MIEQKWAQVMAVAVLHMQQLCKCPLRCTMLCLAQLLAAYAFRSLHLIDQLHSCSKVVWPRYAHLCLGFSMSPCCCRRVAAAGEHQSDDPDSGFDQDPQHVHSYEVRPVGL